MGFWKSASKGSDNCDVSEEDRYQIEWRNKFLAARAEHLLKKLKKAGRATPLFDELPEDLISKNKALQDRVKRLENLV